MKTPCYRSILIAWMAVMFLGWLSAGSAFSEQPQSPAHRVPADAAFFLRMDDIAQWRRDWTHDPLQAMLKARWGERDGDRNEAWAEMARLMEMTPEGLFDAVFGKRVIVFGDGRPEGASVMLMDVGAELSAKAIDRLGLKPDGRAGEFALHRSSDDKAMVGVAGDWVAVSDVEHREYLVRSLRQVGEGRVLANRLEFRQWLERLPAEARKGEAWVDRGEGEYHAMGLRRNGAGLVLEYAGVSTDIQGLLAIRGGAGAREFGPLPRSTAAAVALNVFNPRPPRIERLNMLTSPKPMAEVLEGMGAPVVIFLGTVGVERNPRDGAMPVPVMGMAMKVNDPAVQPHLEEMGGRLMAMLSLHLRLRGHGDSDFGTGEHRGVTYHRMDLGRVVMRMSGHAEFLRVARPAIGMVGPWLVATTHEAYFRETIDAHLHTRHSLAAEISKLPLADHEQPVFSMFLRPAMLTPMLDAWATRIGERREAMGDALPAQHQATMIHLAQGMELLSGILKHHDDSSLQLWREGDDPNPILRGRLELRRKVIEQDR
ncbi:MAG: hypothetical protein JJU36_03545 [Phycisphaeraceae bacterium]|nr:hypothetical protein [Phycisphaeraceae bacterium]